MVNRDSDAANADRNRLMAPSVKFNSVLNVLGFLFVTATAFILVPVTFRKLGQEDYGIFVFMISLLSFSSVLYLGFGTTIIKYVADYTASGKYEAAARLTGTLFGVYLGLGALTLLVAAIIAIILPGIIDLPPGREWMYRAAVMVVGLQLALAFPFNVYGGILIGMQRYAVINVARIVATLANFAAILLTPSAYASVLVFAAFFLLSGMIENVAYYCSVRRSFPDLKVSLRNWDIAGLRHLFGFSVSSLLVLIADKLVELTDTLVVGLFLGPAAVALYSIPQRLIQYAQLLVLKASEVFLPRISHLHAEGDEVRITHHWISGYRWVLAIYMPICLVFIFYGDVFQVLWMGENFREMHFVLIVLTLSYLLHMPLSAAFLLATGNHHLASRVKVAGAIANLVLSMILVQWIGMLGVAAATAIPGLLGAVVMPYLCCRYLKVPFAQFVRSSIWPAIAAGVPTALVLHGLRSAEVGLGLVGFVCVCGIGAVTFGAIFLLAFERESIAYARGRLREAVSR